MGLLSLYRNQSYPVKYIIFAGTVITSVGERPLHNVVIPSFRAIFRKPSKVELIVLLSVSSTAHAAVERLISPILGAAKQYSPLLKKTSRQHAVTPRFGGRELKARGEFAASFAIVVRGEGTG